MENLEVVNIEILNEEEKAIANKLFNEYYPRIQRLVKSPLSLKIHFKEYDKEGKKKKYSINAEAIFSGGKVISSDSWSWDFARAIHKAMKKLETEIEHKFHKGDFTK
ncbi:hypothetical protein A3K74_02345 [Candidatus Pacearchaeota archaeon RBG_13_33_26]|nr:MAG: hypothetical protein A3K74_02345 [Candidatus Pacearchaeota archaeon RBG_13_33_26]